MAHEQKTSIGDRNILVQHGAGSSTTVWLEVELQNDQGITCVALTGNEAIRLGRAIVQAGLTADARQRKGRKVTLTG